MSDITHLYCAVTSRELPQLSSWGFSPALLAYRISPQMQLLRSCPPVELGGGLLVLSSPGLLLSFDPFPLCRQILQECRLRGAGGVMADWEELTPPLLQLTQCLARELPRFGLQLFVPERCAGLSDQCRVLISSALSGGTLETRLKDALGRFGPQRTALALERVQRDFALPCPDGQGRELKTEALQAFIRQRRPSIYWSEEYRARYFTYWDGAQVHFVLYDDGQTLVKKLELAKELGLRYIIVPWQEIAGQAAQVRRLFGS